MAEKTDKFCNGKKKYSRLELADIILKAGREGKYFPVYFKCAICNKFHLL